VVFALFNCDEICATRGHILKHFTEIQSCCTDYAVKEWFTSKLTYCYGNRYQIFDIEIIQNSNKWSLHFLIAMKFVRHEDTSLNFTLKFRAAAHIMQ
jgi:hypothetical protein